MKRYYYITTMAVIAILCFQAIYIRSLYNQYIDEKELFINNTFFSSVDDEFFIHTRNMVDDIIQPIRQNDSTKDRISEDLKVLDSLFNNIVKSAFPYRLISYNRDKMARDSIGSLESEITDYTSGLFPIEMDSLRYLQVKANIPIPGFIEQQIRALFLSVCFLLMVLLCLIYHLTVIRRKSDLLLKQEESVNGTIHDLKTPLNSAITVMSFLKTTETNDRRKKVIEVSMSGLKHLVYNIESLLNIARKDRKRLVLNKTSIDIPALAKLVKEELDVLYQDKLHCIEIKNGLPDGIQTFADGMYIENVIRNFVENALKYSDEGVTVEVYIYTREDRLHLAVKDNGWGIAPRYQKKLFRQFYQVPRSKEKMQKGYGIGLTQAKYIIDEHAGEISLESREGKGSVFTFTIPLK